MKPIPTWEERYTNCSLETAMRAEIDALRQRCAELEALKSGPYFGHYQDALGKIARLEGHIKHIGNDALRSENAALKAELDAMKGDRTFAGWFTELDSAMSYRLWEQGGREPGPGDVALYAASGAKP